MSGIPAWVNSPAIQVILNKLVDRLDSAEARGSASAQTLALNATTWPELYHARFESDKEHLWEQFLKLAELGWVQVTPETARRAVDGYDKQPRVRITDEKSVRQAVGRPERRKSASERWREAVFAHLEAPINVKRGVAEYCIDLSEKTMDEVVTRLNSLNDLVNEPLLLREVSARLFWGMSKVLDNRAALVALILGVDECPFPESPIQVQAHLPEGGFEQVLFVENQVSFEQATRSQASSLKRVALVYASGFKGSASRLRVPGMSSLYYSSRGSLSTEDRLRFESWLFNEQPTLPVSFWGDLDWSGMRILASMRGSFPQIGAWEPGYELMLKSLLDGRGHAPDTADKKGQKPVASVGCSFADLTLIPALHREGRFVDQEGFSF